MLYLSQPYTNYFDGISRVFVISQLGKYIKTDLSKSINSFAELLERTKGYSHLYAMFSVNWALFWDNFQYLPRCLKSNTIDDYKSGLDTHEFITRMATQLGLNPRDEAIREEIETSWKAMTVIDQSVLDKLSQFTKMEGVGVLVVTRTNRLHLVQIFRQLQDPDIKPPVVFSTSFMNESLDLLEIARRGVEQNSLDVPSKTIISDKLNREALGITKAKFTMLEGNLEL